MSERARDHEGNEAFYGRQEVNGVRLHYVKAGSGKPIVLLHGCPLTSYYWRKVFPLLTPHYTVLAPDLRGLGDSAHPPDGFDMQTMASDIAELTRVLGFDKFSVHGEDWGAACAYQLAASYPDRIEKLSFGEMLLPGFGLEEWGEFQEGKVQKGTWLWHLGFFYLPDFPEALITGREDQFIDALMRAQTFDPTGLQGLDEYVRCIAQPGGLRSMLGVYRATFESGAQNKKTAENKLTIPVQAVGSKHFIGEEVRRQMEKVANDVRYVELDCGHTMAEERPEDLARELIEFFGK